MTTPEPHIVIPEESETDIARVIETMQLLLLKYPAAAQATYSALVAEGRRFARTDEGRSWRARLHASADVERFRSLWEAGTFNVLQAGESGALPGPFIDLVAQAVSRLDLEQVASALTDATVARPGTREGHQ